MLGKKKSARKLGRKRDTANLKQKLWQPESLVGWNAQDFLPVTSGGPGFHLDSAVLQWEKVFSLLIWHMWDGNPDSIHPRALWSTPIKEGHGRTGASPVEDTIGQEAGVQGVWRVSKGDGCVQLAEEKALGYPHRCTAIGWEAKVKSWNTGHSDQIWRMFIFTMGVVKDWKRGCWCSLEIFKTQLDRVLQPDLIWLCLQQRWPPEVPPNLNYSMFLWYCSVCLNYSLCFQREMTVSEMDPAVDYMLQGATLIEELQTF